jgi:hypothetical protein
MAVMDRRRCSPRRRWARFLATASLSTLGLFAAPHGGWLAPTTVLAHKPMPSPTPPPPTPTPAPSPTLAATPGPTPAPTASGDEPSPSSTPEHHGRFHSAAPAAAAATTAPSPPVQPAARATSRPRPTSAPQLTVQETSVPTTLASFAQNRSGRLSPYVLSADVLAGIAVLSSLLLSELRRRRLV